MTPSCPRSDLCQPATPRPAILQYNCSVKSTAARRMTAANHHTSPMTRRNLIATAAAGVAATAAQRASPTAELKPDAAPQAPDNPRPVLNSTATAPDGWTAVAPRDEIRPRFA